MEGVSDPTLGAFAARASFWRRLVLPRLALERGELSIDDEGSRIALGAPDADGLRAHVTIRRARFWRRVALRGTLGAAEAYIDGDWDADDLTALIRLFARNLHRVAWADSGASRLLLQPIEWLTHALARNTRRGARRHIAAHYDLGNAFFELMLDPTLTYSCGLFERDDSTLEQASLAKIDRLCRLLRLGPDDHLLELGTGWGSLALRAATQYGCRVTTTTISAQQHAYAAARVAAAGLADRVTVLLADYRDLTGVYSKMVSVEMLEAVGAEYYHGFFATCRARLRADGLLALQTITIADAHFERARREVDFIKRYVFPGGCVPSVTAVLAAATAASDLGLRDLADLTPHYPRTLAAWRQNLDDRAEALTAITSGSFRRLWRFYLAYSEAGFLERRLGTVQMLFARPDAR